MSALAISIKLRRTGSPHRLITLKIRSTRSRRSPNLVICHRGN